MVAVSTVRAAQGSAGCEACVAARACEAVGQARTATITIHEHVRHFGGALVVSHTCERGRILIAQDQARTRGEETRRLDRGAAMPGWVSSRAIEQRKALQWRVAKNPSLFCTSAERARAM